MVKVSPTKFSVAADVPKLPCDYPKTLRFEAVLVGASGTVYKSDGACAVLVVDYPTCPFAIGLEQKTYSCERSPSETLYADVYGASEASTATVRIQRGSEDDPVIMTEFAIGAGTFEREVTLDTTELPEGQLEIESRMFVDSSPESVADSKAIFIVDRTPPTVEVLEPLEGGQACVVRDPASGREFVNFVVSASDVRPWVTMRDVEFRQGELPWAPTSLCATQGSSCGEALTTLGTETPRVTAWEITERPELEYSLRFGFCDQAGHTGTVERTFTFTRQPAALAPIGVSRVAFSPNGDGRADEVALDVRALEPLRLSLDVRHGSVDGPVVRHLVARDAAPGDQRFVWDGLNDESEVVADGVYVMRVTGTNACGRNGIVTGQVVVDRTPPLAAIVEPASDSTVAVGTDVQGIAADEHLASFELAYQYGGSTWTLVASGEHVVGTPPSEAGFLGRWMTPTGAEGDALLRLAVTDTAENTAETQVHVRLIARAILDRLMANPPIYSPNGDGRRDTTSIEYELLTAARTSLEVVTEDAEMVRAFVLSEEQTAGVHRYVWDGATNDGSATPDGRYSVRIRVEGTTGGPQLATAGVIVDRAPPSVTVVQPGASAFLAPTSPVRGSIEDPNLANYRLWTLSLGGPNDEVTIGGGAQNQRDANLASLASLTDGAYRLRVRATDLAENERDIEVPFSVDTIPPRVALHAPQANAVLDKAEPVEIRGAVVDANLDHYTVGFGAGTAPPVFDEIARGMTGGEGATLAAWNVSLLPDGDFTIQLRGTDRAGQTADAVRTVTLDGTPPEAVIEAPAEGIYVTKPLPIVGTASDRTLTAWDLEIAAGAGSAAYNWSPLASGKTSVVAGSLVAWDPLPPDGVYTLRLTVRDKAGHLSQGLRTVKVDQTPPAAPAGLAGRILAVDRAAKTATLQLTWKANTELDLAGYRVSRPGVLLTPKAIAETLYEDPARREGEHLYEVEGVDLAGNVSLPASTKVKVDLTPPLVEIQRPAAGATVSRTVEIQGTAWSAPDFKEYRLYVGASEAPTTWTLLTRSPLPVLGAALGTWSAPADGRYVLAVEGEDVYGNEARVTSALTVDTVPPEPPLVLSVAKGPAATTLTSTWTASPSPDVAGYLLYRGGQLANATGVVIGDPRAYLIPALTYADVSLPDGHYCYRVVAMDHGGNNSAPSDEDCEDLDNRAPRATIIDPTNEKRFDSAIRVSAVSPDTDVARVQFQMRPHAGGAWADLGAPDLPAIYETMLDPMGLALGAYDLRAVATDHGGRTDAAPPWITVTYGDVTPPAIPTGVVASVDGRAVRVTWTPNAETDVAGYRLFRDGVLVTATALLQPEYDDNRDPGLYEYTVTVIDSSGNESAPSGPAAAVVYQVTLDLPEWPVTLGTTLTLAGHDARPATTIEILRDDSVIAQGAATEAAFQVPGVSLVMDGNIVRARGVDAAGNRSIPSEEVVVIRNASPQTVTGLTATVAGHDVTLNWDANVDPDRHGQLVHRDETSLTPSTIITEGRVATATSSLPWGCAGVSCDPIYAIDGDPATKWVPDLFTGTGTWTVTFPRALVDRVALRFAGTLLVPTVVSNYRVEVAWEGRYVPIFEVFGNTLEIREHVLPTAFATDSLRVVVDSETSGYTGLSEVEISKIDVLQPDAVTLPDPAVVDGYHDYDVRAIDRYGAQSESASVRVAVGDVEPPAAPIALAAAVVASDVHLTWTANTEPDLREYLVFRDNAQIGTASLPSHIDTGRPNGTYTYMVKAVDQVDHASPPSNEAVAVVAVVVPPPVLRGTAAPEGANALEWDHAGAAGFTVQRALTSGGPYSLLAQTPDVRAYLDETATHGRRYFYVVNAFDAFGNDSQLSNELALATAPAPPVAPVITYPTDSAHPIEIDTLQTVVRGAAERNSLVTLEVNGVSTGSVPANGGPMFGRHSGVPLAQGVTSGTVAPDGKTAAYLSTDSAGQAHLTLVDLANGSSREILGQGGQQPDSVAFSPDGRELAYAMLTSVGGDVTGASLFVRDLTMDTVSEVYQTTARIWDLRWSPDGTLLAFAEHSPGTTVGRIALLANSSGAIRIIDALSDGEHRFLRWSPDGSRIACFHRTDGSSTRLRLIDVATGAATPIDEEIFFDDTPPAWSPDSRQVAFVGAIWTRSGIVSLDVSTGVITPIVDASGANVSGPAFDPSGAWLSFSRIIEGYPESQREVVARNLRTGSSLSVTRPVPLRESDPNPRVLAIDEWTADGRLALSIGSDVGLYSLYTGSFEVQDVILEVGENTLRARATDPDSQLSSPDSATVHVAVIGALFPDLVAAASDLVAVPVVPAVGRPATLLARVANTSEQDASDVDVVLTLSDAAGRVVANRAITVPQISSGAVVPVSVLWTPTASGIYQLRVVIDEWDRITERREDNNAAQRNVTVVPEGGSAVVEVVGDRECLHSLERSNGEAERGQCRPSPVGEAPHNRRGR